jgi:hypothetical protein
VSPYLDYSARDYFELHDPLRKIRSGEALAVFAESILGRRFGSMLELGCRRLMM